jgi:hypothetical protein
MLELSSPARIRLWELGLERPRRRWVPRLPEALRVEPLHLPAITLDEAWSAVVDAPWLWKHGTYAARCAAGARAPLHGRARETRIDVPVSVVRLLRVNQDAAVPRKLTPVTNIASAGSRTYY